MRTDIINDVLSSCRLVDSSLETRLEVLHSLVPVPDLEQACNKDFFLDYRGELES